MMEVSDVKVIAKTALIEKLLQARALLYSLESVPLPFINQWITGQAPELPTELQQKALLRETQRLLHRDANNFAKGIYPLSLLGKVFSERHLLNLSEIYWDSFRAAQRRRDSRNKEFDEAITEELKNYPEYYRRNFHHQTNGYLSEDSARRYDLQVELLFRGMADPMRRSLLAPMVKWGKFKTILEIGCGTGKFTSMLARTFPTARILAVDMSPHYVNFAKKRCAAFTNIDFMVAEAENLPFKNESFDAVVAVYLLHELPREVRDQVVAESLRVSKKAGFWGMLDSLQLGDISEFDSFLEKFPQVFHEPFYKNYITNPLRGYFKPTAPMVEEAHLLSKVLCRKKIEIVSE